MNASRFNRKYLAVCVLGVLTSGPVLGEGKPSLQGAVDQFLNQIQNPHMKLPPSPPSGGMPLVVPPGVKVYDRDHAKVTIVKPTHTQIHPEAVPGVVNIKFAEDSAVRLRNGNLQSLSGKDLSAIYTILGQKVDVKRTHSQSEKEIDDMRQQAQGLGGDVKLQDFNLYYQATLASKDPVELARTVDALNTLDIVELAYPQQPASLPVAGVPVDLPPVVGVSYESQQVYIEAPSLIAPVVGGINARAAWQNNVRGEGVKLIDIEWGWDLNHEDLELYPASLKSGVMSTVTKDINHGTAVLGEIVGYHNNYPDPNIANYGVSGIAPKVDLGLVSVKDRAMQDGLLYANGITGYGDIALIELDFDKKPVEIAQGEYNVIRALTSAGKIVIEPAGNGGFDLGGVPLFGDSGAIIVGGAGYTAFRTGQPLSGLNYGTRVDVHGWGDAVQTAAYRDDGSDPYINYFDGTSSASAIVAGAAALVQSYFKNTKGRTLNGYEMRELLKNTGNVFPGQLLNTNHIGPLPDVIKAAASRVITPSIYANGQSDSITVPVGTLVQITANLDPDQFYNTPSDWWLITDWNGYWYYASQNAWHPTLTPMLQTGLFPVSGWKPYEWTASYPGKYVFYFGVDTIMDGTFLNADASWQKSLYYKTVTVNVQ